VRLETLLQVTGGEFDLRLAFDRRDRVGEAEIAMKAEPQLSRAVPCTCSGTNWARRQPGGGGRPTRSPKAIRTSPGCGTR
jgi:hypothetical protein